MQDKFRQLRINLIIGLIATILTVCAVEGGARLARPLLPPRTSQEMRESKPLPYHDADYFTELFLYEASIQPGGYTFPDNTHLLIPNDFEGSYFNVVDGQRVTVGQPAQAAHTIYIFGGSTVYSSEVPDDLTIPSQLQRLINEAGLSYRVENYGVSSVTTAQQIERLRTVGIRPGDIVIFYDGINDVAQALWEGDPGGWMIGSNRERWDDLSVAQRIRFITYEEWHDFSAIIDLFLYPFAPARRAPLHIEDEDELAMLTDEMQSLFLDNVLAARDYADLHGATFYHFLQPHIFTLDQHSLYEESLIRNHYLVGVGSEQIFDVGYPALNEALEAAAAAGVQSFDISGVIDADRSGGQEFYLDNMHIDDDGNALIAQAIYDRLFIDR